VLLIYFLDSPVVLMMKKLPVTGGEPLAITGGEKAATTAGNQ
jgi:hypothetical protein